MRAIGYVLVAIAILLGLSVFAFGYVGVFTGSDAFGGCSDAVVLRGDHLWLGWKWNAPVPGGCQMILRYVAFGALVLAALMFWAAIVLAVYGREPQATATFAICLASALTFFVADQIDERRSGR